MEVAVETKTRKPMRAKQDYTPLRFLSVGEYLIYPEQVNVCRIRPGFTYSSEKVTEPVKGYKVTRVA